MGAPPVLEFEALAAGLRFDRVMYTVTEEMIAAYVGALGSASAAPTGVVPPGFAGLFARASYLSAYTMPPGGVLLSQSMCWIGPVRVGEAVTLRATVRLAEERGGRRTVTIETLASDRSGEQVAAIETVVAWP
jgi:acyl dehydratase